MNPPFPDRALARYHIAVLIPAYRVAAQVAGVIQSIPGYVRTIIVVDDASPDRTSDAVPEAGDPRVTLIRHERNQGVGGAMRTAFAAALERGAQICIKIDGDGQMDAALIGHFCRPIIQGEADFVKGNRFMRGGDAESMPLVRKLGNTGLSFLVKMASGYWRIFDPTNGYFAVRRETVEALNWHWIGADYFFEISLLVVLHSLRSAVRDIPIRARYADEVSSLNPWRVLVQFPGRILRSLFRRIWYEYFQYDFGQVSLLLLGGSLALLWGTAAGVWYWQRSVLSGIPTTGGQVMISALPIMAAVQMLIQAMALDMTNATQVSELGPLPAEGEEPLA